MQSLDSLYDSRQKAQISHRNWRNAQAPPETLTSSPQITSQDMLRGLHHRSLYPDLLTIIQGRWVKDPNEGHQLYGGTP